MGELIDKAKAMAASMSSDDWEPVVTLGGLPQIHKPGWEITAMTPTYFQAIAISSRYRFVGIGKEPSTALADAYGHMREFAKELKQHMEAT